MSTSAANLVSGSTVVITGAASGIDRALAQRLSSFSCPVAIADVDERGLKETDSSGETPICSTHSPAWRLPTTTTS